MDKQEKREIAARCFASTEVCCKTLFPERFKFPFSQSHKKVFAALDDPTIKYLAIAAWRGFGKSSIMQLGFPAKRLLSRDVRFSVPISCTAKQAQTQSENLKRELITNPIVLDIFGSMKSQDIFSQEMWKANNPANGCSGSLVFPRSMGQQVRGVIHENFRPDLIIIDDLESKETVHSEEQRAKVKDYVFTDVLGAIDLSNPNTRIIYIGTVLHNDSMLMNLLNDPNWTSMRLEICNDDLKSNWPERHTDEDIEQLYKFYESQGLLDQFFMEYRNIPSAMQNRPFASDMFKYFTECSPNAFHVVIVDPAKTTNENSCDTAIVGLGIDTVTSRVFVEDIIAERFHPDQIYEQSCAMADRIGARYIAVEETGLNEFISWPFKNYVMMHSRHVQYIGLKARTGPSQYIPVGSKKEGKDARISAALVPLYRQGLVYHKENHPMNAKLEAQLVDFPMAGKKDIIDAMAYVAQFLASGDTYMVPPSEVIDRNMGDIFAKEDAALSNLYGGADFSNYDWMF